jgi:hypothetical protein
MFTIALLTLGLILIVAMTWIGVYEQRKAKRCTWLSWVLYILAFILAIPWIFYTYIFVAIVLYGV